VSDPAAQSTYQVRFEWGTAGLAVMGSDVDVVIWVDQFATEAVPSPAVATALRTATLDDAAEIAEWVLARQVARGDRFTVAVVAAGTTRADGTLRVAVEDLLAAGAVIEALAVRGIDYQSPEAAVAGVAFLGLPNATRSLMAASVGGREQSPL
jgi:2-phosphosulfolactate phosphatase